MQFFDVTIYLKGVNLTYKADFGFSVFVNRLKSQRVSEGPHGLK